MLNKRIIKILMKVKVKFQKLFSEEIKDDKLDIFL
jgi:hypothetical protein